MWNVLCNNVLTKRAASPGAVSFVQFEETANVLKIIGLEFYLLRIFSYCSVFGGGNFLHLCAEKYPLNDHEFCDQILYYYYSFFD
jgi:hypothetical protein